MLEIYLNKMRGEKNLLAKEMGETSAIYIYIYIYINGYTSGCTKEREVRSEIKLYLYIFFQVSFSFCVFDHLMFLK